MTKTTKEQQHAVFDKMRDRLPDEVVTVIRNDRTLFATITQPQSQFKDPHVTVLTALALVQVLSSIAAYEEVHDKGAVAMALDATCNDAEMYARCMAAVWQERARCVHEELVDTE